MGASLHVAVMTLANNKQVLIFRDESLQKFIKTGIFSTEYRLVLVHVDVHNHPKTVCKEFIIDLHHQSEWFYQL